jgi:hypothetical protein
MDGLTTARATRNYDWGLKRQKEGGGGGRVGHRHRFIAAAFGLSMAAEARKQLVGQRPMKSGGRLTVVHVQLLTETCACEKASGPGIAGRPPRCAAVEILDGGEVSGLGEQFYPHRCLALPLCPRTYITTLHYCGG